MPTPLSEGEFRRYYRNLPHWRARGYPYFVTWRIHKSQPPLSPEERDVVVEALCYFNAKRYDLHAYVVMDDHVHLILYPEDNFPLEKLCHTWKSFTAHEFVRHHIRQGNVWQDESFDRILRDEEEYYQKVQYILNNPWKRWPDLTEYKWVWAKGMDRPAS